MTNHLFRRLTLGLAASCALVTGPLAQQREFVQAQRANADAQRNYTWKSRTELRLRGETKAVTLDQVRYDLDGRLQKTAIGGSRDSQPAGRGRGGPIRQHAVERKQEEFKDLVRDLSALAGSYAHLPPDRLNDFARQADFSRGRGIETGSVRVHDRGVLQAGDDMVVFLDPATLAMRRIEIAAALDAWPVHIVSDFRTLDNGLTYQARSLVRYPHEELEITIENFQYEFVGRPR